MADDFIAPVKGINKAFENGIKLARGVARSASDAPALQALRIAESAKNLQKSLEKDGKTISEAYRNGVADLGKPFSNALMEDSTNLRRLKDLRIDLLDQINDCPDFDDEPESFDPKPFNEIQKQGKICCVECLEIFGAVREQLAQAGSCNSNSDDSAQLSGMRTAPPTSIEHPPPPVPPKPAPILDTPAVEPPKPRSPWSLDIPLSDLDIRSVSPALSATSPLSGEVSPLNEQPRLIPRDIVSSRLNANDDFLERRRQSRILWQDQIRQSSISSISEIQNNSSSPIISPALGSSMTTVSPVDNSSRLSGIAFPPAMARAQSQNSQRTRSSRTSSILHDIPERPRPDSTTSQESIFGLRSSAPLSPPQSEHRTSGPEWGALATTLRVPGFGNGVEDGLEVVSPVDHGNGLMLVSDESQVMNQPTPATSLKSTDYPIRHDASFYKFGGFCDGARELLKGETGFKIVKRPSGHYSATISAKCIKCSYEVGYKDLEKDEKLDSAGIYGNCGIRWRQLFVSKCHVKTNSVEEPIYACIFCIEEHKTVEEHDATVFFSVTSLFRHLATHSIPLPTIKGINTIYGLQPPTMIDFDIHFTNSSATPSQFCLSVIAPKVASRPAAYATTTHHPKSKTSAFFDPAGNPTLHFASGARILGITFPVQFKGDWCIGYHDGQRGSFPASTIMLETPRGEDVDMSPQSNLTAIAKWDFKPKDAKDGGWLKFSRGDKITNIGYTFVDQWCWSGQTSKGKWGLFPAAFVERLREGPETSSSSTSPGSTRNGVLGGLSGRISGFGGPLRRSTGGISTSGKAERSASIRSNSSGSSLVEGRRPVLQPGLEVTTSSSRNWRGS